MLFLSIYPKCLLQQALNKYFELIHALKETCTTRKLEELLRSIGSWQDGSGGQEEQIARRRCYELPNVDR